MVAAYGSRLLFLLSYALDYNPSVLAFAAGDRQLGPPLRLHRTGSFMGTAVRRRLQAARSRSATPTGSGLTPPLQWVFLGRSSERAVICPQRLARQGDEGEDRRRLIARARVGEGDGAGQARPQFEGE